ncbi:hypothetical protein BC567DRAFT_288807 [Phyllosticta citribraziliensis]
MPLTKPVLILDIDSDSSNSEDDNKSPPQALSPAEQQPLKVVRNQIRQVEAEVMAEESELQQIIKELEAQEGKISELQTRNAEISQRHIRLAKENKRWKKVKKVVSSVASAKREYFDGNTLAELLGIMEDANKALDVLRMAHVLKNSAKRSKACGE